MWLKKLFKTIKNGITRFFYKPLPFVSEEKVFGNFGEDNFVYLLSKHLSSCEIKRNVLVNTPEGNAEIDCLILYCGRLFAVEVKRWKGKIVEDGEFILQLKTDKWTGEVHRKKYKSPFKQLNRAVYLLKKQFNSNLWINSAVFFDNAQSVDIGEDKLYFTDIKKLAEYIANFDNYYNFYMAKDIFYKCVSADCLVALQGERELKCLIDDSSLIFDFGKSVITRKDINYILINHHFGYDKLQIYLKNGTMAEISIDDRKIKVTENQNQKEYSLSKINVIYLGDVIKL